MTVIVKSLLVIIIEFLRKLSQRFKRDEQIDHTVNLIENIKTPDDRDEALKALDDIFHDNTRE